MSENDKKKRKSGGKQKSRKSRETGKGNKEDRKQLDKKKKKKLSVVSSKILKKTTKPGGMKSNQSLASMMSKPIEEPPEFFVDLKKLTLNKKDIIASKIDLLRTREATGFEAKVKCLVQTFSKLKPNYTRNEVLQCVVICPLRKPDMLVTTPEDEPVLNFGTVAIGTKARKWIYVHNTRGRSIYVRRTILDTDGVFYLPFTINLDQLYNKEIERKGIMVEPDHTLELPVFFYPKHEITEMRFFELFSGNTIISLKVTGKGSVPNYIIKPTFKYAQIKAPYNGRQDFNISVENDCDAPLPFSFKRKITKEGSVVKTPPITRTVTAATEKESKSDTKKGSKKKETGNGKKHKTPDKKSTRGLSKKSKKGEKNKNVQLSDELPEYLLNAIENDFKEISGPEPYYEIPDIVTVGVKHKEKFLITFSPPLPELPPVANEEIPKKKEKRHKSVTKKTHGEKSIENKVYVTVIQVYLGDVVHVADWTIVGTAAGKADLKGKKKGDTKGKSGKKKK